MWRVVALLRSEFQKLGSPRRPEPIHFMGTMLSHIECQTALRLSRVSQARGKHMVVEIEAFDGLLESVAFMRRHDVLKTQFG